MTVVIGSVTEPSRFGSELVRIHLELILRFLEKFWAAGDRGLQTSSHADDPIEVSTTKGELPLKIN